MKFLRGLAAGALTSLILGGFPYLLVRYIGNPWPPEGVALDAQLTDNAVIGLVAVLVWVLWAQFTLGLVLELYAALVDRPITSRVPVFGIQQDLARVLVGAIITTTVAAPLGVGLDSAYATTPASASPATASPATASSTAVGDPAASSTAPRSATANAAGSSTLNQQAQHQQTRHQQTSSSHGLGHAAQRPEATSAQQQKEGGQHDDGSEVSVSVQRGDSLWSLAETYLGDGDRWSQIAEANSGRVMADGTPFVSADQIRPGWTLTIPDVAPSRRPTPTPEREQRPTPDTSSEAESGSGSEYRVETGDTLWDIAEERLDDPTRYPEIAEASRGTTQPGGVRLSDPDVIDVGWTVTIPPVGGSRDQTGVSTGRRSQSGAPSEPGSGTRAQLGRGAADGAAPGEQAAPGTNQDGGTEGDQGAQQDAQGGAQGSAGRDARQGATRDSGVGAPGGAPGAGSESSPQARGSDDAAGNGMAPEERAPGSRGPAASTADRADGTGGTDGADGTGRAHGAGGSDAAGGDQQQEGWMLSGLAGGGLVLAGGLLLGLRARRRAQFRNRRPGRAVAAPPTDLAGVEKSITISTQAADTVEHLQAALRSVAAWSAAQGVAMPALAAVELPARPAGDLVLHLAEAGPLPAPWRDDRGTGLHWRLEPSRAGRDDDRASVGSDESQAESEAVDAPYPLLVTVGSTSAGDVWLLNLEELGGVQITGDLARGRDFVRYVVAELAMNPWSHQAHVDCVGVAGEVAPMNPDRVQAHDPNDPAALDEVLTAATAEATRVVDRARATGGTAATGRTGQLDEDAWPARLLVLDHAATCRTADGDDDGTAALVHLVHTHPGRTATSVILLGEQPDDAAGTGAAGAGEGVHQDRARAVSNDSTMELHLDAEGHVLLAMVGLELDAVGLTATEAHGCASLLAQAASPSDVVDAAVPVAASADQGWASYADLGGGLRREHTTARHVPAEDLEEPAHSLLPAPAADYVREAAITEDDLATLAPHVPVRVRQQIEDADPTLDTDLTDWLDQTGPRPRLRLLGPVTAQAHGKPLAKQRAYMTELLAYLTLRRPAGATRDEVATAFDITPAKTRDYVRVLRSWLGENPRTGEPYLPHAHEGPAAQTRGMWVYQIDSDVLLDVDLFARLRLRGEARGSAGIEDLRTALKLVTGRPFDQLRGNGWAWLVDHDRPDHHMTSAVADVAFLVATHSLERRDIAQARAAAEIGALAAPDEEATRLCLVRVCEAEGNGTEADRILRAEVCDRSDDDQPPPDLSERTTQIIRNHRWLETGPLGGRHDQVGEDDTGRAGATAAS